MVVTKLRYEKLDERIQAAGGARSYDIDEINRLSAETRKNSSSINELGDKLTSRVNEIVLGLTSSAASAYTTLIATIISVLAIFIPLASFLAQSLLKDFMQRRMERHLDEAQRLIKYTSNVSAYEQSLDFINQTALPFLALYDVIDRGGRNREFFESLTTFIVGLTARAYELARALEALVRQEHEILTSKQAMLIHAAVNNYVFFLASRNMAEDKAKLSSMIPVLEKIYSSSKAQYESGWWNFAETLAWAKFQLGRASAATTSKIIQEIFDDSAIDSAWKLSTKKRYDLYNDAHAGNEVELKLSI